MDANEQALTLFTTRVRQLLFHYQELKKENESLQMQVRERDTQIKELEDLLAHADKEYNSLKMAKMIEITDGDMDTAQKRLSKLIREVNKCITLLSEK